MMELIYLLQDDPNTTGGILRDPIWQFLGFVAGAVGVLIALVALIAFLVQWRRSAKKPDLRYAVETYSMLNPSTQNVLGRDAKQLPNVRLFVGDSQMENPKLVTIRVVNAGRREIRKEDFDSPLLLDMGEDSGLVLGTVSVDGNRSGIAEALQDLITWSDKNRIEIAPMLLNSGDQFDLGFIVEKADAIGLTGRIAGVDEVKRLSVSELYGEDSFRRYGAFAVVLVGMTGAILAQVVASLLQDRGFEELGILEQAVLLWVGMAILVGGLGSIYRLIMRSD